MSSAEKPPLPSPRPTVAQGDASELASHKDDIFFAAIELTRMPMLLTDPREPDNPIVFANRAFLAMTGYAQDDVIGRNCRFLQGPETDRDSVAAIRDAVAHRSEISLEILNYRKDGSSFWNALFISPVFNHQGELVHFFASQLDVSRRRDAEESLAQAQKMEALGQLTGGISHDFNNLLQVMAGQLEVLRLKERLGKLDAASLDKSLKSLQNAVSRASTLTQQLLAFSRKQKLQGRVLNLNKTIEDMADVIGRTVGEGIRVDRQLDPAIANCQLDSTQFETALVNLLVNARDAMPAGGVVRIETRPVEVRADDRHAALGLTPGSYACVSVIDAGDGIHPSVLGRVMEPFFTTKEEGQGTGLGLAMVYGFARQSGGMALIDSEVGAGTSIHLFFPAARHGEAPSAGTEPQKTTLRGGTERILVVDDRPEVAELAAEMLRGLGYTVWIAHDGNQALGLVKSQPDGAKPQLLFSDIVMPGSMNGYVLAQESRRAAPGLQILLTTGFDRDMAQASPGASSEFEVIKKPYRLEDLARRVRTILDGVTGARA